MILTTFLKVHILILINDIKSITNFENNYQLKFISFVYIFQIKVKLVFIISTKILKQAFINRKYIKLHKFSIVRLQRSIKLWLINNKLLLNIIYMTYLIISLVDHINTYWCLITNLSKYNIIINIFWLPEYNL